MTELKRCPECDADMNLHFRVQQLWARHGNGRWTVGIAMCECCGEVKPFRSECIDYKEFNNDAIAAWNATPEVNNANVKFNPHSPDCELKK